MQPSRAAVITREPHSSGRASHHHGGQPQFETSDEDETVAQLSLRSSGPDSVNDISFGTVLQAAQGLAAHNFGVQDALHRPADPYYRLTQPNLSLAENDASLRDSLGG